MGTATRVGARRDTSLDVLRTLAALGVVATHARWLARPSAARTGSLWEDIHTSLWVGSRTSVYLFFALSGFLIARPFVTALLDGAPLPAWRDYARRRVARIVPAYWLAFTAFLVFGFATGATFINVADHYLLLHNEVPGDAGNLLPVAWTLGIEASFYVAVPLVATLARRRWASAVRETRLLVWLGGLTVASVALHLAVFTRPLPTGWGTVVQYTLPAQFLFFAPGVVLAVVALLSGLILCLGRWSPEPVSPVGRAMVWVGTVSYGLYLWHWLVMRAMYGWWGAPFAPTGAFSWPLSTAVVFALSLPLAAASFSLVERPAMRLAAGREPRPEHAAGRGGRPEHLAGRRGRPERADGQAGLVGPDGRADGQAGLAGPDGRPAVVGTAVGASPTLASPTTLSSARGSGPW
jgi:peptidoglycan/LPS O-acetylase OafA/YrhL